MGLGDFLLGKAIPPPRLMVVESQYRRVLRPLLTVVSEIAGNIPSGRWPSSCRS